VTGIEVEGLEEVLANIETRLHSMVQKGKKGLKLAGQAYANDVKQGAPYLTGTLRRSIHAEPPTDDDDQPFVLVGTDLPYARRLEYGFLGTDALGRYYHQPPQPYFRPPLDTQMPKYLAIIAGAMSEADMEEAGVTAGEVWEGLTGMIRPDILGGAL
jgi:hypothetical protein